MMRIHSISKVLAVPIVILALYFFYISEKTNTPLSVMIIIPAILVVVLYVFHGPLDHWWLSRFPIPFDEKLRDWLMRYFRPYTLMNDDERNVFEYRLGLYMDGRLFQSVGSEMRDVPEDIKCMVSAHGIYMGMGRNDYLIGDMDRIFLYKHPFPTPDLPFYHTVETNLEDGVIILSLEQLTNAMLSPHEFYNIAFHAYAEAYKGVVNDTKFPAFADSWPTIKMICGWDKNTIQLQTGLENVDETTVHLCLFFSHSENYKKYLPEEYELWCRIFSTVPKGNMYEKS